MKTNTKHLLESLTKLRPIFNGRASTIPAATVVKLTAKEGRLSLSANNLDIWYETTIDADDDNFEIAVAGEPLLMALKSSDAEECQLKAKDGSLFYSSGSVKLRRSLFPLNEILAQRDEEDRQSITIDGEELRAAIGRVIGSVSADQSRPALNGINFQGDSLLHLTATEGHILASTEIAVKCHPFAITVPTATCDIMKALSGEVELQIGDNSLAVKSERARFVSVIIADAFPVWRNHMPSKKELGISITVNREQFLASLPMASLAGGQLGRKFVNCLPSRDHMLISSAVDECDAEKSVPCSISGNAQPVRFDADYAAILLRALSRKDITLQMRDTFGPILMEDGNMMAVLQLSRVKK